MISVIGFLAISATVSFNIAQMRKRDGIRKADFTMIRKALELNYKKHGAYTQPENFGTDGSAGCVPRDCARYKPEVGCVNRCATENYPNGTDWDVNSDLRDLVTDGFLENLPKDPLNNSTYNYTYEPGNADDSGYSQAGQFYSLCATLEIGGNYCLTNKK